ncbi:MAG TPA: carboxypeptidase-like regulatory domain-containing protein [Terriglobia bacterium]|nr:carboxypeptidase-like regulatory domain-containing protein [Terriglobia bacterium]
MPASPYRPSLGLDDPSCSPQARSGRLAGGRVSAAMIALALFAALAGAQAPETPSFNINVLVKDADSGQPMNQAHLTLQFREPPGPTALSRRRMIAYSAKTNSQGRCRFTDIPKGTVRLIVTAEHHQAFSKEFDVTENNQELEVKLKPPQPLL